jgi:predicted SAM-dependent methyltransferase
MTAAHSARERLKDVPGLVPVVHTVRHARLSALRAVADARLFGGRVGRKKRIDAYLRTHADRKLQLGAGGNVYEGWLNTDVFDFKRKDDVVYLDARKPFPLPDASFDMVFSEHMIEHLTYADGLHCLRECRRVLRPGGRIRVATPSLDRLISLYEREPTALQRRYVQWAVDSFVEDADAYLPGFVLNNFLRDWGHRFVYDSQTLRHALESAGFVDVEECPVGRSRNPELAGLERHLDAAAADFNEFETMVLEARRP